MEQKIVLIGAGSAMFGCGILGDILKCEVLMGSTVVLHDLNPTRLKGVADAAQQLVVDVPAVVDRRGVHGIKLSNLPKGIAGLMHNQFAVNDLVAEAAVQQSRDLVFQAVLVNPLVDSVKKAERLLEAILEIQRSYLGYLRCG